MAEQTIVELERRIERLEHEHDMAPMRHGRDVSHHHGTMPATRRQRRTVRWSSQAQMFGYPVVDIAIGPDWDAGDQRGYACGIIAVGDVATGAVALGGIAQGGIAVGGLSWGLVAVGGVSFGFAFALGGVCAAAYAIGGVAAGLWAQGGVPFSAF